MTDEIKQNNIDEQGQPMFEGERKEKRFIYASTGRRLVAALIDLIIFLGLSYLMNLWVDPMVSGWFEAEKKVLYFATLISSLPIAILVYFVPSLFFKDGRTLGKKLMKLKLIRRDGGEATSMYVFVRTILGFYAIEYFTSVFFTVQIPIILFISALLTIVDKYHRAFHDFFAGTLVVEEKQEDYTIVKYMPGKKVDNEFGDDENKAAEVHRR